MQEPTLPNQPKVSCPKADPCPSPPNLTKLPTQPASLWPEKAVPVKGKLAFVLGYAAQSPHPDPMKFAMDPLGPPHP